MPEQVNQQERPELGYTSLGGYLDANRGSLDQAFQQAGSDAGQFRGYDKATVTPGQASSAQELGRQFSTESGLGGSGRFGPTGPASEWNAGLNWAAHGPGYQELGNYLNTIQPAPQRTQTGEGPGVGTPQGDQPNVGARAPLPWGNPFTGPASPNPWEPGAPPTRPTVPASQPGMAPTTAPGEPGSLEQATGKLKRGPGK